MSKRLFKPRDFLGPATESSERLSKESQQQGRAFENVLSMIGDDETLVLERCMKTAEAIRELPVKGQGHELRIEVLTMLGNRITMCLGGPLLLWDVVAINCSIAGYFHRRDLNQRELTALSEPILNHMSSLPIVRSGVREVPLLQLASGLTAILEHQGRLWGKRFQWMGADWPVELTMIIGFMTAIAENWASGIRHDEVIALAKEQRPSLFHYLTTRIRSVSK